MLHGGPNDFLRSNDPDVFARGIRSLHVEWGRRLNWDADSPPQWRDLVLVLLDSRKPRPDKTWLERFNSVRQPLSEPDLRQVLVGLAMVGTEWEQRISALDGWVPPAGDPGMAIARGAIWALSTYRDGDTRDLLQRAIVAWSKSSVGTPALGLAAVWSLAQPADDEAMRRLLEVRARVAHRTLRGRLDEEIEAIAARSGASADDIADELVPDHGLNQSGERTWQLDDYTVTLRLGTSGPPAREIRGADASVKKTLPPSVRQKHAETWQTITRDTKAVAATVSEQRARLEDAMIDGRVWPGASWDAAFGRHPVLGRIARRLVWSVQSASDRTRFLMPAAEGGWRDARGEAAPLGADARLSVVHPLDMPDAERAAWQAAVVDRDVVQPFKQLFRETYVVTPAEREAGWESPRLVGLPVSLRQVYALARTRGWSGPLGQTYFDGSGQGWREFSAYGVRCVLRHDVNVNRIITVESVHFEQSVEMGRRRRWERMRLEEVPPIPFSEAMRDIDLIVSVSAMGTESQWQAWEEARRRGDVRWTLQIDRYETSLREISTARAALIRTLLPRLGLSDSVAIEGHFALVQGHRARYRIHLGTGNVHVEPDGRYLCIVPSHQGRPVLLPFEDADTVTSVILSKLALLADDASISDPGILAQLPDGPAL